MAPVAQGLLRVELQALVPRRASVEKVVMVGESTDKVKMDPGNLGRPLSATAIFLFLFIYLLSVCLFCITSFIFIHFFFLRFKFNLLAEWVIVCI